MVDDHDDHDGHNGHIYNLIKLKERGYSVISLQLLPLHTVMEPF